MAQLTLFPQDKVEKWSKIRPDTYVKNGQKTSAATPIKQALVDKIFKINIRCVSAILNRQSWANSIYHYFDLNAGPEPGESKNGAISFLTEMIEHRRRFKCPDFKAILIDNNKSKLEDLQTRIDKLITKLNPIEEKYFNKAIVVQQGDNEEIARQYLPGDDKTFGLIYNDPYGKAAFNLFTDFSLNYPKIDILINCNCVILKRVKNSSAHPDYKDLETYLTNIDKTYRVCSDRLLPTQQWLMMLLTNWGGYPKATGMNLTPLDEEKWNTVLTKANFTREEIKNGKKYTN